jgi:hypothetical protein
MRYLLDTKKNSLKHLSFAALSIGLLLAWLFVGYVHSYLDEESRITFFVKKFPTFKVEFYNPDASESDYEPFNQLSSEKKHALAEYCTYKFGVTSDQAEAIENCRKNSAGELK